MTIRAKLAINVISLVCIFLIVILVMNIETRRINEATGEGVFANRIVIGVSDMNTITHDYVMNPSERARQQWELKHASLGNLIKNTKFAEEDKRATLNRIRESHGESIQLFKQILENNQKRKRATAAMQALLAESSEGKVTQLMARSQIMISDAYSLSRISYAEISDVQSWAFWLITAVIFLSMLVAGAVSYLLIRSIDTSIRALKEGTEVIAGGDLNHRVSSDGKDEIAALAQAFNDMTGRLSTSYKSLAEEVWDKEKAREALRIANLYTRSLIEVSLDPLVTISTDGKIMDVNHATELATGVPREQLIGSNFSVYFTDPKKAQEGYGQVFSGGFVRDYPLAIRHVSGRTTEVLYNSRHRFEEPLLALFRKNVRSFRRGPCHRIVRTQCDLIDPALLVVGSQHAMHPICACRNELAIVSAGDDAPTIRDASQNATCMDRDLTFGFIREKQRFLAEHKHWRLAQEMRTDQARPRLWSALGRREKELGPARRSR